MAKSVSNREDGKQKDKAMQGMEAGGRGMEAGGSPAETKWKLEAALLRRGPWGLCTETWPGWHLCRSLWLLHCGVILRGQREQDPPPGRRQLWQERGVRGSGQGLGILQATSTCSVKCEVRVGGGWQDLLGAWMGPASGRGVCPRCVGSSLAWATQQQHSTAGSCQEDKARGWECNGARARKSFPQLQAQAQAMYRCFRQFSQAAALAVAQLTTCLGYPLFLHSIPFTTQISY